MIRLENLCFSYQDTPLLSRCSLTVPSGAHIAIMGPSGQGKTTLLRLILGLERPRSGSISVTGRISCVFQEPRLLPWCTALENVNAVLSDSPETLPQAKLWLERLELEHAANQYPSELSGGMQQRLSIARALAYRGDVLLLDEPLKGCDAALRTRLLSLLQQESIGKTLLLITHDDTEANALADTIYLLDQGRLVLP